VLRKCDGTDPNLRGSEGAPCDCGLEFDDVERTVIFPHTEFTSKPTEEELQRLYNSCFGDELGGC
jgi:hypothetical protein